jgi:Gluconate 2-dehydrogenase subunit 3
MTQLDRRTAMKWVLAASAAAQLPDFAFAAAPTELPNVRGYGKDPNMLKVYKAGELWPLTLTDVQRRTTRALCDLIIPADEFSPAATAVATDQFIDEWISAPYPIHKRDRDVVTRGLEWLDAEAQRRYRHLFADGAAEHATSICDDICDAPPKAPELAQATAFFARFRELTAIGYYTTPIGMKDLRYTGNEPLVAFNGPPAEVLKRLGL